MKVSPYDGFGYIPTYERSTLTNALHNISGFLTDTEIITEKRWKNYPTNQKIEELHF